ncbi:hypothetical protein IEN85_02565 [Pelagicoccus sp. NFK12]|uniref:Uncharacterized protein n=1 Tax=Pelagicoccus enzymogenes TaxID=2773457 RepID=A0A927F5F5_9BACT|nr:hypothetical protein [Pelagicoccus enzymogenes]MBD5778375.1 hypothetical protein [Pelagicoccus enzymogenes]
MKTNRRLYLLVLGLILISVGVTGMATSKVNREATKEKAAELFDGLIENVNSPFVKGTEEYEGWKEFQKSTRIDLIAAEATKNNSFFSMTFAAGIGLSFAMGGALLVKRKGSGNRTVQATSASHHV